MNPSYHKDKVLSVDITHHWCSVAVGTSSWHISIDLANREHKIRVSLWIPDNKDLFDTFVSHKTDIETVIDQELVWDKLEGKKAFSKHLPK